MQDLQTDADMPELVADWQANTDGAKSVGIATYLFDGNAQRLREYIGL